MIINTRPVSRSSSAQDFFDADVVPSPVLETHFLLWPAESLDTADALIITSQTAVEATAHHISSKKIPVFAVGSATALAASRAGFEKVTAADGTAVHLLCMIDEADFTSGVYLSAKHVSRDLAVARPDKIKRQVVYEMRPVDRIPSQAINAIKSGVPFVVPFYSPRSLEVFEQLVLQHQLVDYLSNGAVVLIHERLESRMTLQWRVVRIAKEPSNDSMVTAVRAVA